jgi:hypothetical protein
VHRGDRLTFGVAFARALAVAALLAAAGCSTSGLKGKDENAPVPTAQRQAAAHVERMRSIQAAKSPDEALKYNAWLDEAWKFFLANPKDAVPVLRRELAVEMARKPRNDFMLLDLGYFLHEHGEERDRAPAREALLALDPGAPIMRFNEQELFEFTHAAASDGDERVLDFIDRVYLRTTRTLQITVASPQASVASARAGAQALTLDTTGVCVVLYGSYGPAAEAHLRRGLADPAVRRRAIETLIWIGTPDSNADVRSAMIAAPQDYETFVRGATFLIGAGGPQGRFLLMNLHVAGFDARSRDYYAKIRKSVQDTSFAQLAKAFDTDAHARLPDEELKRRLAALNSGYGSGERVSPEAIVHSTLPRDFLIEQLKRSREASLRRLTGSSLGDVRMTGALLNTLYYRER